MPSNPRLQENKVQGNRPALAETAAIAKPERRTMQEGAYEQDDSPWEDRPKSTASRIWAILVAALLGAADLLIQLLLRTRANERTLQPTRRRRFPPNLKQELFRRQDRMCIICGKRRLTKNLQIDHINPVVREGENEIGNLQLLCAPYNQRKGVQTNEEFYQRYQRVASQNMLRTPPRPSDQEIPQSAFRNETRQTQAVRSVQEFRRTKYISAKAKINGGSLASGGIAGGAWLVGLTMFFPNGGDLMANIALFGGIVLELSVYVGLVLRARYTGTYEQ